MAKKTAKNEKVELKFKSRVTKFLIVQLLKYSWSLTELKFVIWNIFFAIIFLNLSDEYIFVLKLLAVSGWYSWSIVQIRTLTSRT